MLNEILLSRISDYRFIVINNFPNGFSNESITALIKILNNAQEEKIRVLMTKEYEPSKSIADLDTSIAGKLEVISFDKGSHWDSRTLSQIENIKGLFTLNFGSSFSKRDMKEAIEVMNVMHQSTVNPASESFEINDGIKIPIGIHNNKKFYFRL